MMGESDAQRWFFYTDSLETFVPDEHPLRRIRPLIDEKAIRRACKDLYSPIGRPSIPPEQLSVSPSILDQCLDALAGGRSIEECAVLYPGFTDEVTALLHVATELKNLPQPEPRRTSVQSALVRAAARSRQENSGGCRPSEASSTGDKLGAMRESTRPAPRFGTRRSRGGQEVGPDAQGGTG